MFKAIMVPIDISQRGSWEYAIPQSIELVASNGIVTVTTVVRDLKAAFEGAHFPFQVELMMSSARDKLAQIVSRYRGHNLALNEEVLFGSIGRAILQGAHEQQSDLIVMASHRPEMTDHLIGPNAAYMAQHARCSVFVLRSR